MKFILTVILFLFIVIPVSAGDPITETDQVCPAGSAKWEAPTKCEYGCTLFDVALFENTASWRRIVPGKIANICIKAGRDLYWVTMTIMNDPAGMYTVVNGKDVSHIVLYLEPPTAVSVRNLQAERIDGKFSLVVIPLIGLILYMLISKGIKRHENT